MSSMHGDMKRFWDARAREAPFFFIDNRLTYRDPDLDLFWSEGQRDLDHLLQIVGAHIAPTDHVLEIGCGVGRLTRVLAGRAYHVIALDVSSQMLDLARSHNSALTNVEWMIGDGYGLCGVADQSIDSCISHVVFQHIPDPTVTLGYVREIGRVLRSGGWAAFQISNDPGIHHSRSPRDRTSHALRALARRAPRGQNDPRWRGSMVNVGDLHRAASDGGMTVEAVVGEGTQMCCLRTRRM
jgi:SAM-dependent methyltransferase